MTRERVLITVKTYPTLSRKYGETVCTAGVRADGSWVRIYPVPFRRLDEKEQYRKFDWIEAELVRSKADKRPATRRPAGPQQLVPGAHLSTSDEWLDRRALILGKCKVYTRLAPLIAEAKTNETSLAVFKPSRIGGLVIEAEEEREWDPQKLVQMRNQASQKELFDE